MRDIGDERKLTKLERLSLDRRERKREGKKLWKKDKCKVIRESHSGDNLINKMPKEPWDKRHARRLAYNVAMLHEMESWAESKGVKLIVHDDGRKWLMFKGNRRAVYRPETAGLQVDQEGYHVHDWKSVIQQIESVWNLGRFISREGETCGQL